MNAVELTAVTKTYGRTRALDAVDLVVRPRSHGAPRPQRRRQDHAPADRGHVDRRRPRRRTAARARPARLARRAHRDPPRARLPPAGARLPRRHDRLRLRRVRRRPQGVERPRSPARARYDACWSWSASATWRPSGSPSCPAASGVGSRWPRRCSASRGSWCSTSRRPASTRRQRADLRRTLSVIGGQCAVLLSTHQTEDVAALCERVVVLAGGTVRFDGTVTDLVATAAGRVWLCDEPGPDALRQLAHRDRTPPRRRRHAAARRHSDRADARGRLPAHARRRRPRRPRTRLTVVGATHSISASRGVTHDQHRPARPRVRFPPHGPLRHGRDRDPTARRATRSSSSAWRWPSASSR